MSKVYVFDIEADGLLDEATKIHCLSYTSPGSDEVQTLTDYDEMIDFLAEAKILIAHNAILYDKPVLEKLLGVPVNARIIDTLALSWYLNHDRIIHGLDSYGKDYGVPKPKIDDWENLTLEEYCHRCEEDVKINQRLWSDLRQNLLNLYENWADADRFIKYLMFKMKCAALQQESRWRLDKNLAQDSLDKLTKLQDEAVEELKQRMPQVPKYVVKSRPAKPFKKDGTYSTHGAKWFALLREEGFPKDYEGEVKVLHHMDEPNPNSHEQVKAWLTSLGWEPQTFKFDRNKETGEERQIPQVRRDGEDGKELCPSVTELIEVEPAIKVLEDLTTIQHRLSIFKGFLENEKDGFLIAEIGGLTNTLRFKHRVLVNLPGVSKAWGEAVRGSLIAREGYELCGSDMSSLEDNTKRHYMWNYDPDYVIEMSRPGFDPHLDLALHAGSVTQQEVDDYVGEVEGAKNLKPIRTEYKQANYSCIYGVGAAKLARTLKITRNQAQALIDAYWERNWAIRKLAEDTLIKHCNGSMWLFNPVSKFWYSLRNEKDIFSTLNQGTGVYCFDSWVEEILKVRKQLTGQFHDEIILEIKKGNQDKCRSLLKEAIARVNDRLKLNVQLDVDVQFGDRYSDIH